MLIQSSPFLRHPVTMGGAALSPFTPSTLPSLQLYLDTRLGLGSVVDGGSIASWPDQSGHSPTRDAVAQAGWNNPTLARTGNVTPKGLPAAIYAIPDNPTPQGLGSAGSIGTWPSISNGYTIYWYGMVINKTTPAWQFLNQPYFSSDGTAGTAVQAILNSGGAPQSYGLVDNNGGGSPHRFGTEASIDSLWKLHTLLLPPPDNGTVPCRYFINGVEVSQSSGPANYQSNIGTGQYFIGNSQNGNISMRGGMGWIAWYNTAHTTTQIALMALYSAIFWGLQ